MFSALTQKISGVFNFLSKKGKISSEQIKEVCQNIKIALIDADVSLSIVEKICSQLELELSQKSLTSGVKLDELVQATLFRHMMSVMQTDASVANFKNPSIILMIGLQGSGKTTSIAKLAHLLKTEKSNVKKILATSVDFRRPAAVKQLEVMCQKAQVDFFSPLENDIFGTISAAKKQYQEQKYDYLFIDTPGRMHVNSELMLELQEISQAAQAQCHLLVIDSMTGQESINVARAFEQSVGVTSTILSKVDSDAGGGVALSFFYEIKKPIWYVGIGEHIDDLEKFVAKRIISRLLGSGDIESLAEKIERKMAGQDKISPQQLMQKMLDGTFDLEDMRQQAQMMQGLGPLSKVLSYIPGMGQLSGAQISQGQTEMKKSIAIINSMTPKERKKPQILDLNRKKRISLGAGCKVDDVNSLLNKFEESKVFVRMLKRSGKL